MHIGQTSPVLCVDALRAAVAEAKKSENVSAYKTAWSCIRYAAPNDPAAQLDQAWINRKSSEQAIKLKKLNHELAGYRNSLVKESIRVGAVGRTEKRHRCCS